MKPQGPGVSMGLGVSSGGTSAGLNESREREQNVCPAKDGQAEDAQVTGDRGSLLQPSCNVPLQLPSKSLFKSHSSCNEPSRATLEQEASVQSHIHFNVHTDTDPERNRDVCT